VEITPVPHPAPTLSRGRVLGALLLVGPVIVLVVLPAVLGLDRYVVADAAMEGEAAGSLGKGSVALTRDVPAADLETGDVITFRPPVEQGRPASGPVTRRIVSIQDGVAWTQADNLDQNDPWRLDVSTGTYSRVVFAVPLVGYPFTREAGLVGWLLLLVTTATGLVLAMGVPRKRGPDRAGPTRKPSYAGVG